MSAPLVINFDVELPAWSFFSPAWCAKEWHCTPDHIVNLIETGELPIGVDLRGHNSSKMMLRIPRKSLLEFLNRRKNLEAVKAANPRPKTREDLRQLRAGKKSK